ncbi:MAG: sigma factor-like helix-turn-helix DNA-binding protein [Nannocystaceae bacterium]
MPLQSIMTMDRAEFTRLAEPHRDVCRLVDLEGMSYKAAAAHLGCPVGTAMSRLHRARKQLRSALGAYAYANDRFGPPRRYTPPP